MGLGTFVHHIGTFLLLAATVLLIVTSISAPVINNISLLRVDLHNADLGSHVEFGSFGYCVRDSNGTSRDACSGSHIGYNPISVMNSIDSTDSSSASEDSAKALTRVMVLHPLGAGLCFIAFLLCLGTGIVGSLVGSLVAVLAFIVTAVAIICDFVGLAIVRNRVNENPNSSSNAKYGVAIWLALVAAACTLVAASLVFITCCAGRVRDRRHQRNRSVKGWNEDTPGGRF